MANYHWIWYRVWVTPPVSLREPLVSRATWPQSCVARANQSIFAEIADFGSHVKIP